MMDITPDKKAILFGDVKTERDIKRLRKLMIKGNYPASISDCYVVGINGNCGTDCPVFKKMNVRRDDG